MLFIKELNLKHFVKKYKASSSKNRIDTAELEKIEKLLNFKFGKQLKKYILKYGFLSFEYLEFYGITTDSGIDSNMIIKTIQFNKYFPMPQKFIVFENWGDGMYYLVDKNDKMYCLDIDSYVLTPKNVSLYDYICERFKTANRMVSDL
ncbi:MAG: SMI1/KNR4 family protein [Candidatus Gastranaerophilaceae bacterium]